eukprot:185178-Pyramimonas_sp.AAC.1
MGVGSDLMGFGVGAAAADVGRRTPRRDWVTGRMMSFAVVRLAPARPEICSLRFRGWVRARRKGEGCGGVVRCARVVCRGLKFGGWYPGVALLPCLVCRVGHDGGRPAERVGVACA